MAIKPGPSFKFPKELKKSLDMIHDKAMRSRYKKVIIEGIMQGGDLERRSPKDKKQGSYNE